VPDGDDLRALLQWLAGLPPSAEPFHCTALGHVSPALSHLGSTARGVLAVRLSPLRGDFLVWLRREHNGSGSALPWAGNDIALAGALGGALVDMILQVNAVRLLIAESQLAQVRATVAGSQEAVVVCDTAQRAFFANAAFHTLAGRRHGELTDLETLAGLFMDPRRAHAVIGQVRAEQRPWHGELALRRPDGSVLPVAMRAEPVPARDRTLLGCILIFDDLSEAKRADAARARLEAVLSQVGRAPQAPDGHDLVGAIIANASLAAMDIAEGGSGPAVAPLLQEVEASTARATALLDCIRQFTGKPGDPQ
jgi:PAS domain S-box-containing protein